jgi:hypothetical protein
MMVADRADGPQCRAAALNHLYVDQAYAEPSTKILLEMIRLTETVPQEPVNPPVASEPYGGGYTPFYRYPSRYGKCRVRK